ncbi:hypothetical protein [Pontibacter roseus]|uniref:hypothetical protein n=1 Tax=Pontibacter roseus TaxID=336989 RepID=UPI001FDED0E7|nr:hypothetical protein [Pontibacter roseus]
MAPKVKTTTRRLRKPVELRDMLGNVYLTLLSKKDYLEAKWTGHITADDVVSAAQVHLELLRNGCHPKLLNDKSEVTGDWQDANDWLEFEWLPKAFASGLRCMAHVFSENMFSRLAAIDLQKRITPELCMENFNEREAAETWLINCDVSGAGTSRAANPNGY